MGTSTDRKIPRALLEREHHDLVIRVAQLERQREETTDLSTYALEEAASLAHQPGYYRMGYQHKGACYWASWKWTAGALAGHYTYASAATLAEALAVVCAHQLECEAGKRKATVDTSYRKKMGQGD